MWFYLKYPLLLTSEPIGPCLYPQFVADKAASDKRYACFSEIDDHHTIRLDSHELEQGKFEQKDIILIYFQENICHPNTISDKHIILDNCVRHVACWGSDKGKISHISTVFQEIVTTI